jgi:hypothetical protein
MEESASAEPLSLSTPLPLPTPPPAEGVDAAADEGPANGAVHPMGEDAVPVPSMGDDPSMEEGERRSSGRPLSPSAESDESDGSDDSASSSASSSLSSLGASLGAGEEDGQAVEAAGLSHLAPFAMSDVELLHLPEYAAYQYAYCDIRNAMLVEWHSDVRRFLDFDRAASQLNRVGRTHGRRIYQFLHRYGLINQNLHAVPQPQPHIDPPPPSFPAGVQPSVSSPGHRRRVVVIGAGASGLAAASQLKAAGHSVVVLEGRGRTGGRVCTERRSAAHPHNQHTAPPPHLGTDLCLCAPLPRRCAVGPQRLLCPR